jgi:hypothetical protein
MLLAMWDCTLPSIVPASYYMMHVHHKKNIDYILLPAGWVLRMIKSKDLFVGKFRKDLGLSA